jgi:hypothetical protein
MGQYVELFNEQKHFSTGKMVDVVFHESIVKTIEESRWTLSAAGFTVFRGCSQTGLR